jgi:polysaccharide deacetylase family protein (PEP-CTERM system associated)
MTPPKKWAIDLEPPIGNPTPRMLHAVTVDVEDYYHVTAFEGSIPRSSWDHFESRVESSTRRLLELLAERGVRGTFFVLGWIAARFPSLVREIHAAGHELGSHSHWHRLVYQLTPDEFREDLRRSIQAIEDAAGVRVRMYRAPSFSITRKSLWAFDILAEEGIEVDSSVFPTRHDRYGIPDANPEIHAIETTAGRVLEFPPTVVEFGRLRFPVAGGGYFRLYPWSLTARALRRLERRGRPAMFYVHPWEVDPAQPRLRAGSRTSRLRHYVNLKSTAGKLDRLLRSFDFGPIGTVLATRGALGPARELATA